MTYTLVRRVRHGETEWSASGRHTGRSDVPLTVAGEQRVKATGHALIGNDRLIVPGSLLHVARSSSCDIGWAEKLPWAEKPDPDVRVRCDASVEITEDIREWDYGDYEGVTSAEIKKQREEAGLPKWDIWRDGCPGGESPADITNRLNRLIKDIRTRWHADVIGTTENVPKDVLIVAHGHILRAFAMLWVGKAIEDGPSLLLEAGGVGTLSYEHHSLDEPAILLGGSFMVDLVENAQEVAAEQKA
ncbi:phosphoglycerate mutase [Pseudogymnoascus sp. 24MN13]|nr:phosphoglycerate mutase [Pseudogymnoascus sp. 24MN13]